MRPVPPFPRRTLPLLLVLLLPLAACEVQEGTESDDGAAAIADPDEVRTAIEDANRRAAERYNEGDIAGFVDGIYTEDAIILPPGGPRIEGRQGIRDFWEGATEEMGIERVELATTDVEPLGPDRAWEIGRWILDTAGGEARGKYVVIWQRDDQGTWRWHLDIWNEGAEEMTVGENGPADTGAAGTEEDEGAAGEET